MPNEKEVENKIAEIFSVGVDLLHVEFSLESARSSFLKTIEGQPPSNDKNQQFKDGVLWADCVKLLDQDDVFFVTNDKAFFHDRKYENGLAKNLLAEITSTPHKLKIYKSIGELLDIMKKDVVIDEELLFQSFMDEYHQFLDEILQRNNFRIDVTKIIKKTLYATELPHLLYIEFAIDIPCIDLSDQDRAEAVLHMNGTGSYDVQSKNYDKIRLTGQNLEFLLPDGSVGQSVTTFIQPMGIVIGHNDVVHNVRYKIIE